MQFNTFPTSIFDITKNAQEYSHFELNYINGKLGFVVPESSTSWMMCTNNTTNFLGRYSGQTGLNARYVESGMAWTQIFGGGVSFFGIATDGTLWSWGTTTTALGRTGTAAAILQVGSATNWATISVATSYGLGLKTDGTLWSWGSNATGLTAQGTTTGTTATPTQVGSATYSLIGAGEGAAYALGTDGNLYTWGTNTNNGLNIAGTSMVPTQVVAAGSLGTTISWIGQNMKNPYFIIVDGKLYTVGSNAGYGTGLNTNTGTTATFTQVGTSADWQDVYCCSGPMMMGRRTSGTTAQGFGTPYTIQNALTWTVPVTPTNMASVSGVRYAVPLTSGTNSCNLCVVGTDNRMWQAGASTILNTPSTNSALTVVGSLPIASARFAANDACIIFYK